MGGGEGLGTIYCMQIFSVKLIVYMSLEGVETRRMCMDRVCGHTHCLLVTLFSVTIASSVSSLVFMVINKGQKLVTQRIVIACREPQKHVFPFIHIYSFSLLVFQNKVGLTEAGEAVSRGSVEKLSAYALTVFCNIQIVYRQEDMDSFQVFW